MFGWQSHVQNSDNIIIQLSFSVNGFFFFLQFLHSAFENDDCSKMQFSSTFSNFEYITALITAFTNRKNNILKRIDFAIYTAGSPQFSIFLFVQVNIVFIYNRGPPNFQPEGHKTNLKRVLDCNHKRTEKKQLNSPRWQS